MHDLTEVTLTN